MKRFLRYVAALALALGLPGCGPPEIPLDEPFSGTLTASDSFWSESNGLSGYAVNYVVQATAGQTYTVTWGTNTGKGNFEDQSGGYFVQGDLQLGNTIPDAFESSPSTSIWYPAVTGLNKVDVDAQAENVPLTFTIEIVPSDGGV